MHGFTHHINLNTPTHFSNMAQRRDTTDDFGISYYRFFNALQPNKTISSGLFRDASGTLNMTDMDNYSSSENWILFAQAGRYFIRNYDYGGKFQLGIDSKTATVPKLLPRNGTLGQQWTLTKTGAEKSWVLTNGLLGSDMMLGLEGLKPVMTKDKEKGNVWVIDVNTSAGKPPTGDAMIQSVNDMEVKSPSLPNSTCYLFHS